MSRMFMNDVTLCGQVCNTPELRFTKNEVPVTNFVVKTVERWKNFETQQNKSNTKYHKIVCWGNIAKRAVHLLEKGNTVLIKGELSYHKHTQRVEKDGHFFEFETINTEIKATNIQVAWSEKTDGQSIDMDDSVDSAEEMAV